MVELRLEVQNFSDQTNWRWKLTDAVGVVFLADHAVRLDPNSWEFEAFADLRGYLLNHALPGRYSEDEEQIVTDLGKWIGAEVLGKDVTDTLVRATVHGPVTVRVIVPDDAQDLLFRPLELAHAGGRPLFAQGVTLVTETGPTANSTLATSNGVPDEQPRRLLGLFSLPEGDQPLNLRRERHNLVGLVSSLASTDRAAYAQVLQYGVTRERLRDVLEEADGWDIIHVAGHGAPGQLLLETAAGTQDRVTAEELANMLDLVRGRVRLVVLSACWSAADATADQRRLLGLPAIGDRPPQRSVADSAAPGALATRLAERLGCAVLAMRYPIDDDFAIKLSEELYRLLLDKGQPLPQAVGIALQSFANNTRWSTLSLATPALFGGRAIGLKLKAPKRPDPLDYNPVRLKMAGFDPQPDMFVGRTAVMARASAVLATESGIPGMLLHGVPGGGKSACALELAYTHEHAFDRLVFYKAPDEGMTIDGALADFAKVLQYRLPNFQMVNLLTNPAELTAFLPQLTELARQRRMLIVVDNIESLLTESGQWRDDRWGQVIKALTDHSGLSRLILTSRHVPTGTGRLKTEKINVLSASEGLLLARELPNLRKLIQGEVAGFDPDEARQLVRRILTVAQGHPKLLRLADAQAAYPTRLTALISSGEQAWNEHGGVPDGLFTTEESSADSSDYLRILAIWTRAVTDALTSAERELFWSLCCLEEADRTRPVLASIWSALWTRFDHDGQPADLDRALAAIVSSGLTAIQPQADEEPESYPLHPGVAAAGRAHAGESFQEAIDAEASEYWAVTYFDNYGHNDQLAARAAKSAFPYYIRQENWAAAGGFLERALPRNLSRADAAALLPIVQQIARHETYSVLLVARVMQALDPLEAETFLRGRLADSVASRDYQDAFTIAGALFNLCLENGRPEEALGFTELQSEYVLQSSESNIWEFIGIYVERMHALNAMGQFDQVLEMVQGVRDIMRDMVNDRGPDAFPQDLRELLCDIGGLAAFRLGRWNESLTLTDERITFMEERHAPAPEVARARLNRHAPLIELGRVDEARELLQRCRWDFQQADDLQVDDLQAFGVALGGLAETENRRERFDEAIRLQSEALRYDNRAGNVATIAVGYRNLGVYLRRQAHQQRQVGRPALALACCLTAALIYKLTDADPGRADITIRDARSILDEFGAAITSPTDITNLYAQIGGIPAPDPASLIARLSPDPETAERTMRDLIAEAT